MDTVDRRAPWVSLTATMPLQLPNPPPSSENARNTMRANRGTNTGPERRVRQALRAAGLSGYRLNWRQAPGRPDIAYPGRKVAIFVHGCFWHRCPRCNPPDPKAHSEFWTRKFQLNVERDARKRTQLEDAGWLVLEIWECDVRERLELAVARVKAQLATRPGRGRSGGSPLPHVGDRRRPRCGAAHR